jgi:hypothetical protein
VESVRAADPAISRTRPRGVVCWTESTEAQDAPHARGPRGGGAVEKRQRKENAPAAEKKQAAAVVEKEHPRGVDRRGKERTKP